MLDDADAWVDDLDENDFGEPSEQPIDPRTLPVRFSRLKAMARSPLHYWQSCQFADDDSLARRLGSGVHALVFDQPHAVFTGKVRRGKAWDAFKAAHDGKALMNTREHRKARAIADAILRHPVAHDLLFGAGAVIEQPIDWSWLGRACSSRPDSIAAVRITDLKSTASSEPSEFTRQALRMHYHAQLAFYELAKQWRDGVPAEPRGHYLIAVEQKLPHAVTVFRLTQAALEVGMKLCRVWFERLLTCEKSNDWPEYVADVWPLDVPDDEGGFRLVVDGDDITF
jgi:hypothetical protein